LADIFSFTTISLFRSAGLRGLWWGCLHR
jgi:hypothetical protein